MARPLPMELRTRVLKALEEPGASIAAVAARFAVGTATVKRWSAASRTRGSPDPLAMGGQRHAYLITSEMEAFLVKLLHEVPDSTAPELADHLQVAFGVRVSEVTVGRALRRMGYTKKSSSALARSLDAKSSRGASGLSGQHRKPRR